MRANWIAVVLLFDWLNKVQSSYERGCHSLIGCGLWWLQLNSRSPDFRHKVTKKVLWIDGWYTPAWVKLRFDKLQSHVGYRSRDSQGSAQPNRYWIVLSRFPTDK